MYCTKYSLEKIEPRMLLANNAVDMMDCEGDFCGMPQNDHIDGVPSSIVTPPTKIALEPAPEAPSSQNATFENENSSSSFFSDLGLLDAPNQFNEFIADSIHNPRASLQGACNISEAGVEFLSNSVHEVILQKYATPFLNFIFSGALSNETHYVTTIIGDTVHQDVLNGYITPSIDYVYNDCAKPFLSEYAVPTSRYLFHSTLDLLEGASAKTAQFTHESILEPTCETIAHSASYIGGHPFETSGRILYALTDHALPIAINTLLITATQRINPTKTDAAQAWSPYVFFLTHAFKGLWDAATPDPQLINKYLVDNQALLTISLASAAGSIVPIIYPLTIQSVPLKSAAYFAIAVPFTFNVWSDLVKETIFSRTGKTMDEEGFLTALTEISPSFASFKAMVLKDFSYPFAAIITTGLQSAHLLLGQPLHPMGSLVTQSFFYMALDTVSDNQCHPIR